MLCLVTDRHRLAGRLGCDPSHALQRVPELVERAAAAGIDVIQIRERDLDARDLTGLVRACLSAVAGSPTRVVVNDRLDVALAAGAHGVHLRGDSFPIERVVRSRPGFLIGRSVHSADEAEAAASTGANYLIFGMVFPSGSKPDARTAGLEALRQVVVRSRGIPVLAIGGMTVPRAPDVARTGAAGLAGIDLFLPTPEGPDLVALVRAARDAFVGASGTGEQPAHGAKR